MRQLLLPLGLSFAALAVLPAQSPPPQEPPELLQLPAGEKLLVWQGHLGRSYFLQISDPASHLEKWFWAPIIEAGADAEISYEVDGTAELGFFRIHDTDQVPGPGETLETADFDGDGISNLNEITPAIGTATHPLDPDTDHDGLLDGWELTHGLDPNDSAGINGGDGDPDHDGLTNQEEQALGTEPNNSDSDGDGISDGGERDQNTNPNDPSDTPEAEWFILTGDLDEDVEKSRSRTVTIPAGESRLLLVALESQEYPYYTGDGSLFNDALQWEIRPTGKDTLTGDIDVNSQHDDWDIALIDGTEIQGFSPAHIETGIPLTAPGDAPLVVEIDLSATNIGDGSLPSTVMVGLLPMEIKEVSFTGAKYHELKKDDVSVTYSAPHWVDKDGNGNPTDTANGEKDYSVGYTRNTKPSIGAKLSIQGLPNNLAIKLRAKGSDGIDIPETAAQINGKDVTLPITTSSTNWPNTVKFYDRSDPIRAFKLDWEIKVGDSTWAQVASTKHQVYLTLNDPVTALRQETLFFLSSKNANNFAYESSVTNAIWSEFIDRSVSRVDGLELTYYQSYDSFNTETDELLEFGDGQCGAWVKFFIDLRRVQGISDQPWRSLRPAQPAHGLIVKNWDFTEPGTAIEPGFPYFNMPGSPNHIGNSSYKWRFAEVNDHTGIPGQGNIANAASLFQLHSVVFLDGEYLDPSYGIKYLTLQDLDNAMAGFYRHPGDNYPGRAPVDEPAVNLDLNGNGTKTDLAVDSWVITFKKNPAGIDLVEKPEPYPLSNE